METPKVPQQGRWETAYHEHEDFFGAEPSELGLRAAEQFADTRAHAVLELGCGQGRDTLLFLQRGFQVTALDYAEFVPPTPVWSLAHEEAFLDPANCSE